MVRSNAQIALIIDLFRQYFLGIKMLNAVVRALVESPNHDDNGSSRSV